MLAQHPVVDGPSNDDAVHVHRLHRGTRPEHAEHAGLGLKVHAGVPVGVPQDDAVRPLEIGAHARCVLREQEDGPPDPVVEVVAVTLPEWYRCRPNEGKKSRYDMCCSASVQRRTCGCVDREAFGVPWKTGEVKKIKKTAVLSE
jgi:hypothetical protein